MYNKLRKAIESESKKNNAKDRYFIKHGYAANWSEEQKANADTTHGLRMYCTPSVWEKYNAGKMTRTEANNKTISRREKQRAKNTAADLERVTVAENTPATKEITIYVDWVKSRHWGNNPRVTVYTDNGRYYATASGCGYDKLSAAVASAFNESPEILTSLYKLANGKRNKIPYGTTAQYHALPCFEGGVGIDSTLSVLRAAGYTVTTYDRASSRSDLFILTK